MKKREKRDCIIISVEKARHKPFTETLPPASAGTSSTWCKQMLCRFPKEIIWWLRYKILRKTKTITKTCVNISRTRSEPFQTLLQQLLLKLSSPVGICCSWDSPTSMQPALHPAVHGYPSWEQDCISLFCNPNWNSSCAPHNRCKQSPYHSDSNAVTKQLSTETRRIQGSSGTESGCSETWSHMAEAVPEGMQEGWREFITFARHQQLSSSMPAKVSLLCLSLFYFHSHIQRHSSPAVRFLSAPSTSTVLFNLNVHT